MWRRFKTKYHPEEYEKSQERMRQALRRRCQVFTRLMELKMLDEVTVDCERSVQLVKLLDRGELSASVQDYTMVEGFMKGLFYQYN